MESQDNRYWTDVQEQLIIQYQQAEDPIKREIIYKQLQPTLRKMIEYIGNRYYPNAVQFNNEAEVIDNLESYVAATVLNKFDPTRGTKAYSYIGTAIKHEIYDKYFRAGIEDRQLVAIDNLHEDDLSYNTSEDDADTIFENVKTKANLHLQSLIHQKEDQLLADAKYRTVTTQKELKVLKALYQFINSNDDYDKHYLTYFLFKSTGLGNGAIANTLYRNGIRGLFIRKYNVEFYEQIINDYVSRHGKVEDYERKAFYERKIGDEKQFKIQQKRPGKPRKSSKEIKNVGAKEV